MPISNAILDRRYIEARIRPRKGILILNRKRTMPKRLSKTQKKIDNNIRTTLTACCNEGLKDIPGFQWLTHQVDYANFPASLFITCVFDTITAQHTAQENGQALALQRLIQAKLLKIGVKFKKVDAQILFDSEEACTLDHNGEWPVRLASRAGRAVRNNRPN